MNFADKVNFLREQQNYKITDLAKAAGIPYTTLIDVLKGKTEKVSIQMAIALSKVLNCSLDYLIYDEINDRYYGKSYSTTSDIQNHLSLYNKLNEIGKSKVNDYINDLIDNPKYCV